MNLMKKWMSAMPVFLCLLLFVSSVTVFAETSGQDTSQSSSSGTTSTGSTIPDYSDLDFSFRYSTFSDRIIVSWNKENHAGLTVSGVRLGGELKNTPDDTGRFDVSIYDLKPGVYSLIYILSDSHSLPADEKVEKAGQLDTNIQVKEENGRVSATVTDEYGRPVSDCEVTLYFGENNPAETAETDSNGKVTFRISPPADKSIIYCGIADYTVELSVGTLYYTGSESRLTGESSSNSSSTSNSSTSTTKPQATTKNQPRTTTTRRTAVTVKTAATFPMVTGAGTTSFIDGLVAVNVSFDTQVAKSFDFSSSDFGSRARLLLEPELYSSLVSNSTSTLMLQATTSSFKITDQHISAAIAGKSKYSLYHAEDTLRIPLDLDLLLVNTSRKTSTQIAMPSANVTVEFPVPKSMKDDSKFMVTAAIFDENGISHFLDTKTEDGVVRFQTNRMSPVVLLGFEQPVGLSKNAGGVPLLIIGMISLGILMLAGAGFLLYFFFLRKPVEETGAYPADVSAADLYSDSHYGAYSDPGAAAPPNGGVSLGSLANRPYEDDDHFGHPGK